MSRARKISLVVCALLFLIAGALLAAALQDHDGKAIAVFAFATVAMAVITGVMQLVLK